MTTVKKDKRIAFRTWKPLFSEVISSNPKVRHILKNQASIRKHLLLDACMHL